MGLRSSEAGVSIIYVVEVFGDVLKEFWSQSQNKFFNQNNPFKIIELLKTFESSKEPAAASKIEKRIFMGKHENIFTVLQYSQWNQELGKIITKRRFFWISWCCALVFVDDCVIIFSFAIFKKRKENMKISRAFRKYEICGNVRRMDTFLLWKRIFHVDLFVKIYEYF